MRHGAAVYTADFSPDGKQIVTGSAAAEARIWDTDAGRMLTEPLKHSDTVFSARFSPDGKWIVTASWDGTARVWHAKMGQPLTEGLKHPGPVWLAQFSPGGQQILTASAEGSARVWDIAPVHGRAPQWLPRLAEAVSGRRLNQGEVLETISSNRAETLDQIRQELTQQHNEDDWTVWGRWLLADRSTRAVSPFSRMTIVQYIEKMIKANTTNSIAELDQFAYGNAELSRRIIRTREALQPAFARERQTGPLVSKGNAQARAGQWANAIATFCRLKELDPNNYDSYHSLASLLTQSGETQAYRQQCAQVLLRFGATQDPVIAERVAKDCSILPSPDDVAAIARLADTALSQGTNHTYFIFFQFAKGLAEYRLGNSADAAQWMRIVLKAGGTPTRQAEAQFVLAMGEARLKHREAARRAFSAGTEIVEKKLPQLESGDVGEGWIDWIIARALQREAKSVIEGPQETEDSAK
jgi:tetratricopeptide (TPR) repeat protein